MKYFAYYFLGHSFSVQKSLFQWWERRIHRCWIWVIRITIQCNGVFKCLMWIGYLSWKTYVSLTMLQDGIATLQTFFYLINIGWGKSFLDFFNVLRIYHISGSRHFIEVVIKCWVCRWSSSSGIVILCFFVRVFHIWITDFDSPFLSIYVSFLTKHFSVSTLQFLEISLSKYWLK